MTRTSWAVKVYGTPAPKGSMKCVGRNGRHQLVNQLASTKPWQEKVAAAARELVKHYEMTEPLAGPLGVDVTITVAAPRTVKRDWPFVRGTGDKDKHERTVLDGLQAGGLLADDAQVCTGVTSKVYPHTPHPDALEFPGAFIRIYLLLTEAA